MLPLCAALPPQRAADKSGSSRRFVAAFPCWQRLAEWCCVAVNTMPGRRRQPGDVPDRWRRRHATDRLTPKHTLPLGGRLCAETPAVFLSARMNRVPHRPGVEPTLSTVVGLVSSTVDGSVAQLAEQGIHKPRVTGSSPVAAIISSGKELHSPAPLGKTGRFSIVASTSFRSVLACSAWHCAAFCAASPTARLK
jgi:hypothetical protein